jgi:hypothetical protein
VAVAFIFGACVGVARNAGELRAGEARGSPGEASEGALQRPCVPA